MQARSIKHASFLCSSNPELQLAVLEPTLKVPDFVQPHKPQKAAPPSASNTKGKKALDLVCAPQPGDDFAAEENTTQNRWGPSCCGLSTYHFDQGSGRSMGAHAGSVLP